MARTKSNKNTIILNPSFFSHLLSISPFNSVLLFTPTKNPRNPKFCSSPKPSLSLLILFTFFSISTTTLILLKSQNPIIPCSSISPSSPLTSPPYPPLFLASLSTLLSDKTDDEPRLSTTAMVPLPPHMGAGNWSEEEGEFWRQPDGEGYRPCLDFTIGYRKKSAKISKEKRRFLVVAVSGGLNQQRNQIVDGVVIARILEAALVVPILQVNRVWGDESEFSDIFDVEYFKKTLKADVRVVSSLPSTHLVSRQSIVKTIPQDVTPLWIHARFFKQLNEEGLLVLKGLDSRLSKNLPPDLQKLRCKVAFHALRFAAPIQVLGNRITKRMWIEGPYIAIHLRLEKDVWIRTGCSTGLGPKYDRIIANDRGSHPEFLTGKSNMSYTQRKLAGQCPLNAFEVAKLLKGLGAPRRARVYIAGGEPFGGKRAIHPLLEEYPNLVTKEMLAKEGELRPYIKRPSALAAIDYIVSLSSDVFVPSHGGNMGRAMEGHRAYVGHRKYIKPNKRMMFPLFEEEASISQKEMRRVMREMHRKSEGQPVLRSKRRDRDVIAFPVPECMCKH